MFQKRCLTIAIGLALVQWASTSAAVVSTTEEFIEVNDSLSLTDTTKAQTQVVNYDKNVLYKNTIVLDGQGGKKDLTINVKNGQGDFVIRNGDGPIKFNNQGVNLTFNANLVMEGNEYAGIQFGTGSRDRNLNIKGDFIYKDSYGTAIQANTGGSRGNLFVITVDGKAVFNNVNIGGKYSACASLLNLAATDFEAKQGIYIDDIDINQSDNFGAAIFALSGGLKAEGQDISITNVDFFKSGTKTSVYAQETPVTAKNILIQGLNNYDDSDLYGYMNGTAANTVATGSMTVRDIKNFKQGEAVGLYMEADARAFYDETKFNVGSLSINNVVASNGKSTGLDVNGASSDNGKLFAEAGLVLIDDVQGTTASVGAEIADGATFTAKNSFIINNIEATEGDAVGLLVNAKASVGDALLVQNIKGKTSAVGLQLDGTQAFETKALQIRNLSASEGSTVGLLAHQAEVGNIETVDINVNPQNVQAYGGSFNTVATNTKVKVNKLAVQSMANGKVVWDQGTYNIFGHLQADKQTFNPNGDPSTQAGSITISGDARIYGDIYAVDGGTVDLNLKGADAVLVGQADAWLDLDGKVRVTHTATLQDVNNASLNPTSSGVIRLALTEGASWFAMGQSSMTILDNNGTVDMTASPGASVYTQSLKGNGTFNMTLDPDGAKGNMLYVADSLQAQSQNIVNVKMSDGVRASAGIEDLVGVRFATTGGAVDKYDGTEFKAQMLDQGFRNVKLAVAKEAYDKTKTDVNANYNGTTGEGDYKPGNDYVDHVFGDKGTNWYISGQEVQSEVSDAGLVILATARSNYWTAVEMDRLNKRLGDARYANGNDGLWLRMRYESIGTTSGQGDFESDAVTYQLGFDHAFKQNNGRWIVGGALDYKDANVDYKTVSGEGNSDRFGMKVYGTWLGDNGAYVDVNAIWGVLSNNFQVMSASGQTITADYDNHIMGVSAETGHRFMMGQGFFAEPQMQLQYLRVTDANYTTSQGTRMVHDDFDSVISRVGLRGGMEFGEARAHTVYAKADWMHEWSGDQKITAYDVTTSRAGFDASIDNKGSWYGVGFGAQAKFSDASYGFLDMEYRFGNNLDKSWVVNAGVRYAF